MPEEGLLDCVGLHGGAAAEKLVSCLLLYTRTPCTVGQSGDAHLSRHISL